MSGVQYSATFQHGPVSGPLNGFLGAVVVVLFARAWNKTWDFWPWWRDTFPPFPVWLPIAAALLGSLAAVLVGLRRNTDSKNIIFRAVCWVSAGVWSAATIHWGWSWFGFGALAGGAVFAGLLAPGFASYQPPVMQTPVGSADFETELLDLIVRECNIKPQYRPTMRKLRDWDRAAGHTYTLTSARGSTLTWRKVRNIQGDLAAAMQLPDGCPVEAEAAGTHQGATLLHIATKNFLKEPIDYPDDVRPMSITNEFSVGRYLDGTPTLIELMQAAGLAAGQRGGGKTVLLQNITASLVRCVDVVVWHVDLNGGGMAAPWTTPYALGQIEHPAVDWVATTPKQALKMAKVALAIAKDRKARYQSLLIRENVDVLPVRPGLPLIMIMVDEAAEVTGETAVKEAQAVSKALQEVQRIGRAMCVNVFFSTQRATGDYLPAQVKKGSSVAFCTRVKDEAELAHVFDWHKGIDPEMLTEPGQMFIQRGTGAVKMFKGYRLLPQQIIHIAVNTQQIRAGAQLDPRALRVGGDTYQDRWEDPDSEVFLASLRGAPDDGEVFGYETDGDPDAYYNEEVPDDDLTAFTRSIAEMRALRAKTEAAAAQQERRPEPGLEEPRRTETRPAAAPSIPVEDQQRFLAELDKLSTVPDDPRPDPRPDPQPDPDPQVDGDGPAARRAFIVQYVTAAGSNGRKTADIVTAVIAAGLVRENNGRQRVGEDLKVIRDQGLLTQQRGGEDVYAMWWDRDYAA
jgi:hypothetical protein